MADQILRDKMNRKIGVIKTDTRGVQSLYDAMNKKKGTYDPHTNVTRDTMNRMVGKGNLLTTLYKLVHAMTEI